MTKNNEISDQDWSKVDFSWETTKLVDHEATLQFHSLLNILNVISLLLQFCEIKASTPNSSKNKQIKLDELIQKITLAIHNCEHPESSDEVITSCQLFTSQIRDISDIIVPREIDSPNIIATLLECVNTMEIRIQELINRNVNKGKWVYKSIDELESEMKNFFEITQKNSNGRFEIAFDSETQEPNSYLIQFDFQSINENMFYIPPELVDSLRDLAANSRKYSDPGGIITIKLHQMEDKISLSVLDNGRGIPEGEIEKTVGYGYRASNAKNIDSMGGGFGLTKALYFIQRHKGDMQISSSVEKGTLITIEIPYKK